ncbi:hypothetical protein LTR15_008739 [Elasticomyces elasticus]|nr:hypothetical protein LTR15_008739 [Elasticomyces elasticus]
MAPLKSGTSRAASARTSRAGSTARDILKKRNKPYKTEHERVMAKKRKLRLKTVYNELLPGYTFMPVGTPDLAERCKEISRKQNYDVSVVNAAPISGNARNPHHVSHHIARIGYHFRSTVVDEACAQLGYVYYKQHFVKEADLAKQRDNVKGATILAATLARYGIAPGLDYPGGTGASQSETSEQITAAIKELFPKIPEADLNHIVHHAWEKGTDRVGNSQNISLPRRVQLATIARVRHAHTDYDQLLRAFGWAAARAQVEPHTLAKLIEWRGEQDDEEDGELEEIVRETIVIDDDDDDDGNSIIEIDSDSDGSVEIVHQGVVDNDFGAESADDGSRRRVLDRYRPREQQQQQQDLRQAIARQKIIDAKQRIRTGAPPRAALPAMREIVLPPDANGHVGRVMVQPDENGRMPTDIIVDGRRLRIVSDYQGTESDHDIFFRPYVRPAYMLQAPPDEPQLVRQQQPFQPAPAHPPDRYNGVLYQPGVAPSRPPLLPADERYDLRDRPIASIEPDDQYGRRNSGHLLAASSHPATPDEGHRPQHRPTNQYPAEPLSYEQRHFRPQHGRPVQVLPPGGEVIDLISPPRAGRGTRASPMVLDDPAGQAGSNHARVPHGNVAHNRPLLQPTNYMNQPPPPYYGRPAEPLPFSYPPAHPGDQRLQPRPESGMFRYVQVPPTPGYAPRPDDHFRAPGGAVLAAPPAYSPTNLLQPSHAPTQPVHGAPAPVQQAHTAGAPYGSVVSDASHALYGNESRYEPGRNGEQVGAPNSLGQIRGPPASVPFHYP